MSVLSTFHAKAVQGLYLFNHFEHEDGRFIQVHVSGSPIVYNDAGGKFHEFQSIDAVRNHIEKE